MERLFAHAAETAGITVRVQPHFAAEHSDPDRGRWAWTYHVRIENGTDRAVQLLDRHWIITDGTGRRTEVEGPGVVGEQPVIAPGESFDYVSGCPLPTPWGRMEGSYGMVAADGSRFRVAIPAFDLVSPQARERFH